MKNFCTPHCHIQSLDSASTPEQFAKREKELGTGHITCTDHGTLEAVPTVINMARKYDLTPIIGLEAYFRDDDCPILKKEGVTDIKAYNKYYHITLHAKDQASYEFLGKKLSEAPRERHGQESKPLFNWNDMEEILSRNMTLTSGCLIGMVQRHLLAHKNETVAKAYYDRLRSMVGPENFYVEVFPHKCTHNWVDGIFVDFIDGSRVKYYAGKTLRLLHGGEMKADALVRHFNSKGWKGDQLVAVKNFHKWQDLEGKLIKKVEKVEGFIQNECSPWSPDGDIQYACNKWVMEQANKNGDPIIVSDDCLVMGTLVQTKEGLKKIEDIRPGDMVVSHTGRLCRVEAVRGFFSDKKKVKVEVRYGYEILTEDHRVWAMTGLDEDPEWIRAADLKRGDLVLHSKPEWNESADTVKRVDLLEYVTHRDRVEFDDEKIVVYDNIHKKYTESPRYIDVDGDFLWLVGFFLGDENAHNNLLGFAVAKDRWDYCWDKIERFIHRYDLKYDKSETKGMVRVRIINKFLTQFFRRTFYKNKVKFIPDSWAYRTPLDMFQIAEGAFWADGSGRNKREGGEGYYSVTLSMTSLQVASQIRQFLLSQGVWCSIDKGRYTTGATEKLYTISPHGDISYHMNLWCRIKASQKRHAWITPHGYAYRVFDVTDSDSGLPVFDLQVSKDQSFTCAAFSVHNCHFAYSSEKILQDIRLGASGGSWKFHNCFERSSRVNMWDGSRKRICDLKPGDEVVSYDFDLQEAVPGVVNHVFRTPSSKEEFGAYRFMGHGGKGQRPTIICTKDHNFWNGSDWEEVGSIRNGSFLADKISNTFLQCLDGVMLGDANVSHAGRKKDTPYFSYSHCEKQGALTEKVASVLGVKTRSIPASEKGFKGGPQVTCNSAHPEFRKIHKRWYPEGVKVVPRDLELSPIALAWWFMDDGTRCLGYSRGNGVKRKTPLEQFRLYTNGFTEEDVQFLIDKLLQLGIKTRKYNYGSGWFIVFRKGEARKFQEMVAPHILPQLQYKLSPEFRGRYEDRIEKSYKKTIYSFAKKDVVDIPIQSGMREGGVRLNFPTNFDFKYDIEVEGHHCFFVDGILVHNSYHRQDSQEAYAHFKDSLGVSEATFERWVDNSYAWAENFKDFTFDYTPSLPTSFFPKKTKEHTMELIDKVGRMRWSNKVYGDRLEEEFKLLHENGTIDLLPYFFIDEEVCSFYESQGYLTGPGRGSAAGVLLAYLLGITHKDPIKHGLSLDRFLTLDRIESGTLPDIDQDLPNRDILLDPENGFLKRRYGDHVAQVSTDILLKLRSSAKDVSRAMTGKVPPEIEALTKKFQNAPQGVTDKDFVKGYKSGQDWVPGSIETDPALQEYAKKYPQQWDVVQRLLGLTRNKSRHACMPADALISVCDPIYPYRRIVDCHDQVVNTGMGNRGLAKLIPQGMRMVKRYHLENGKTVEATPDHKVLTEEGWMEIEEAFEKQVNLVEAGEK